MAGASAHSSVSSFLRSTFSPSAGTAASDALLSTETEGNRLLSALRSAGNAELRERLRRAEAEADGSTDGQYILTLLLPQSVTLDDVTVTLELLETHLVLLRRGSASAPRPFTSLNGLCGTVQPDGALTVHGRTRRAPLADSGGASGAGAVVGGWEQRGRGGAVPQLESQIVVLRESLLHGSAWLPLRSPIGLLLISDPLFFPGCGWKLPLALRRVTHRFRHSQLSSLPLADLPQLLYEYQILARAWREGVLDDGGLGVSQQGTNLGGAAGTLPVPVEPTTPARARARASAAAAVDAAAAAAWRTLLGGASTDRLAAIASPHAHTPPYRPEAPESQPVEARSDPLRRRGSGEEDEEGTDQVYTPSLI